MQSIQLIPLQHPLIQLIPYSIIHNRNHHPSEQPIRTKTNCDELCIRWRKKNSAAHNKFLLPSRHRRKSNRHNVAPFHFRVERRRYVGDFEEAFFPILPANHSHQSCTSADPPHRVQVSNWRKKFNCTTTHHCIALHGRKRELIGTCSKLRVLSSSGSSLFRGLPREIW